MIDLMEMLRTLEPLFVFLAALFTGLGVIAWMFKWALKPLEDKLNSHDQKIDDLYNKVGDLYNKVGDLYNKVDSLDKKMDKGFREIKALIQNNHK